MADEFINILDERGKLTGEIKLKSEAHRLGLFHSSVHIWFYTSKKEILLQKRAPYKDTFPNLWDVSVAGHISAGETPEYSALREIKEEIGLEITKEDLDFKGVYLEQKHPRENIIDKEFHYIYLSELKTPLEKLKIQEEEVSAVKLIPFEDFISHLQDKELSGLYVPHDQKYYDFIKKEIDTKLNS